MLDTPRGAAFDEIVEHLLACPAEDVGVLQRRRPAGGELEHLPALAVSPRADHVAGRGGDEGRCRLLVDLLEVQGARMRRYARPTRNLCHTDPVLGQEQPRLPRRVLIVEGELLAVQAYPVQPVLGKAPVQRALLRQRLLEPPQRRLAAAQPLEADAKRFLAERCEAGRVMDGNLVQDRPNGLR